ncbi:MAG: ImmA/IrrE family metallo-endopeptidase [Gammaproteobacteria bacterium]|nr:ImmA/IrrE family metallo-endopeptidase [Gammaproteobacteria bacterium]
MATAYAQVNPNLLRWARERADLTLAMLAKKLHTTEDNVDAWESGAKPITMRKAMELAEKTYVPFGFLFLHEQPKETLPIPDLRTVDSEPVRKPSAELRKVVQTTLTKQAWYKDYALKQAHSPLPFVGRFTTTTPVATIVDDMRQVLGVPPHPMRGSWEDYHKALIARIEAVGVLVIRQGHLGHHTKPLSVSEFRGFAIADPIAPVIFINLADAPVARLFTLIHELAHIWIGQSGVSDGADTSHRQEEVLCNAVAAEFLVPGEEFRALWQPAEDWKENLGPLEAHFHVSQWVLARRALTLKFITADDYHRFIAWLKQQYDERERTGSGPSYYVTLKSQTSERLARAVLSETASGHVLLRDAGQLLGMKPDKIASFAKGYER